jgi:hypothetical protein
MHNYTNFTMPRLRKITKSVVQRTASPLAVQITDQVRQILDWYAEGRTLREVADLSGRSIPWVHARIIEALAAIPLQAAERLRQIECAKLDEAEQQTLMLRERFHLKLSNGHVASVPVFNADGTPKMRPKYHPRTGKPLVDEETGEPVLEQETSYIEDISQVLECDAHLLKIRKRRAELLGLDAPIKTSLTDPEGNPLLPNQAPMQFNITFEAPRVNSEAAPPARPPRQGYVSGRKGSPKAARAEPSAAG